MPRTIEVEQAWTCALIEGWTRAVYSKLPADVVEEIRCRAVAAERLNRRLQIPVGSALIPDRVRENTRRNGFFNVEIEQAWTAALRVEWSRLAQLSGVDARRLAETAIERWEQAAQFDHSLMIPVGEPPDRDLPLGPPKKETPKDLDRELRIKFAWEMYRAEYIKQRDIHLKAFRPLHKDHLEAMAAEALDQASLLISVDNKRSK